eukprot:TRINITY_DN16209_c0_g3_i1.p1 TRINITY_DN16209_c0_g3~~TRINITY_DN16209_c0_g3_i1.p1  ORF type:complete len:757 (+),score=122.54 TRINITY_DN16209_c0_g3_i1:77-2272(+)
MLTLDQSYWSRSVRLVAVTLTIWAVGAFLLPMLRSETQKVTFLGFPLHYYLCSQLIPIFFWCCLLFFNKNQEKIEAEQPGVVQGQETTLDAGFRRMLLKVYSAYTGGFLAFVLFIGLLEALGVSESVLSVLFVVFTLAVYAAVGIFSRSSKSDDFFVAGRCVPPVYNGMATAADWMSGASFVGMAGTVYGRGYDGLAFIVGWTGGYVLVSTLVAPYLRRFGSFTVPEFIACRYQAEFQLGGFTVKLDKVARVLSTLVLLSCSFTYLTAQVYSTGVIVSRFISIPFETACFAGLFGVLFCSLLGGMRAVTWTQVAQYIILIVAYLIPAMCMSVRDTGSNHNNPIAQLSYGTALERIAEEEEKMRAAGHSVDSYTEPQTRIVDFLCLSLCLMVGTSSLPHVLMRYFTTPSVKDARRSVTWSLGFILVLYLTAPAYAAFAKLEVYTNVVGRPLADLPQWIYTYGEIGLATVCEKEGVASLTEAMAACNQTASYRLTVSDLVVNKDALVIATPEIAGLPYTIAGLVSAGGLAASLSTADGLLLAISNAISYDIYSQLIDKNATPERQLLVSRILLVVIALLAAALASTRPSDILSMVAWAFSLAAAGNFPVICLGIWWRRTNAYGAVAGIFFGWGATLIYLIGTQYGGWPLWFGISNVAAATFGLPLGFIVTIVVSLLTPAPPSNVLAMVDGLRDFQDDGVEEKSKAEVGEVTEKSPMRKGRDPPATIATTTQDI